jgi:pyruvate kinase
MEEMSGEMEILVTLAPSAKFGKDLTRMNSVGGVRINTSSPVNEPLGQFLERVEGEIHPKDLWVDLKGRQMRVTQDATVPPDSLKISHRISVNTPTDIWFKNYSRDEATGVVHDEDRMLQLEKVYGWGFMHGGNRLQLKLPPGMTMKFGIGAALSITDPSFVVYGYLTKRDKEYINAAKKLDMHKYMISFVEKESDITDVLSRDPDAEIMAKIESEKGLKFVEDIYPKYEDSVRLMAARGDLYVWLEQPHKILGALKKIIAADPKAVAASRILPSVTTINSYEAPDCRDICDVGYLLQIGYRRFLLDDSVSYNKERLSMAVGIMESIISDYK